MPKAKAQLPTATWIAIITGATLCAAFIVWAVAVLFLRPPAAPPKPPFDPVSAHAAWKVDVAQSVASLNAQSSPSDIRAVEQQLLSLTVTANDRDAHLALILALIAFERGETGSYDKLQTALAATQK